QDGEIGQGRDTAGGDHCGVGARAHLAQQVDVGALQGAVLGDVGDHVAHAAGFVEALEGLPQIAALTGPATGGQGGAAHVQADGDAVAVLGDHLSSPLRVLERGGAQVHAAAAGGQGRGQRVVVADPAGELDVEVDGRDHLGQHRGVAAAAEG